MAARIPVIDFEKCSGQLSGLLRACEERGCFRLTNHPISLELLSEMKSVAEALLFLSPEIKRQNIMPIADSGYRPPSSKNPLYEAFGLYDCYSPEAVDRFCDQLEATPEQRKVLQLYSHQAHKLAISISNMMAASLGLGSGLFEGWPSHCRMNRYSFTQETLGQSGVQVHTDSNFLTVLHDDDRISGLEIRDKSGEFVAADPLRGSFLVIIGDMAKAWSNGRFYSPQHRVVCKEAGTRVSTGLFLLGPPKGVAIEAPAQLLEPENRRLYNPFTYEDYRNIWLSTNDRPGEALSLYANP